MPLDLSPLENAIVSLEDAIRIMNRGSVDTPSEFLRDSVIQRFEYTYELAWKFMKRWLSENLGPSYVDGVPRRELFRLAAENRLIGPTPPWMGYHKARDEASHAYNEIIAADVCAAARLFATDARPLLVALKARND
ncbi:MAG: HI0074 family nucleotidyltransferase substrate-binding subunit [Pseudomonadota bacterium]|nr:HI0074 family nucleotidyltransferase substrate-binding subunit [Pseudomonadota bacterium]